MRLKDRDIICLSNHYWDERRFRKQEFMERFTHHNRVLFVEPSFSVARRSEDHLRAIASNRVFSSKLEHRAEQLYLLKPPRGLPKWSEPRIERLTYRWYSHIVAKAAADLGFRNAVLWAYKPAYYDSLRQIPHSHLVFDLFDDLAAYHSRPEHIANAERCVVGLIRQSNLLVATAMNLLERYEKHARHVVHVPNGFDAALFTNLNPEVPPELGGIKKPILGFVGTLFGFLDFELLEKVARFHNDKSLVLVGPVETNARDSVASLKRLPNVFHLGSQPQSSIPNFLAAFDVCLNPFRTTRVAESINPLKVYEYLAAGRPVVSTAMEALRREGVSSAVAFAETDEAFCNQIDLSLTEAVQRDVHARRSAVVSYSWDNLFEQLDLACERWLRLY